jgi:RNA recognition motif-containing protein
MKTGFAFVEYKTLESAKAAAAALDGTQLQERRIICEVARGSRNMRARRAGAGAGGGYRLRVEGLDTKTSWQDLKDFARAAAAGPILFTDVWMEGAKKCGIVEYRAAADLDVAFCKLDGQLLEGVPVRVHKESGTPDGSAAASEPADRRRSRSRSPEMADRRRSRSRSRSPRRSDRERPAPRARSRSRGRSRSHSSGRDRRAWRRSPDTGRHRDREWDKRRGGDRDGARDSDRHHSTDRSRSPDHESERDRRRHYERHGRRSDSQDRESARDRHRQYERDSRRGRSRDRSRDSQQGGRAGDDRDNRLRRDKSEARANRSTSGGGASKPDGRSLERDDLKRGERRADQEHDRKRGLACETSASSNSDTLPRVSVRGVPAASAVGAGGTGLLPVQPQTNEPWLLSTRAGAPPAPAPAVGHLGDRDGVSLSSLSGAAGSASGVSYVPLPRPQSETGVPLSFHTHPPAVFNPLSSLLPPPTAPASGRSYISLAGLHYEVPSACVADLSAALAKFYPPAPIRLDPIRPSSSAPSSAVLAQDPPARTAPAAAPAAPALVSVPAPLGPSDRPRHADLKHSARTILLPAAAESGTTGPTATATATETAALLSSTPRNGGEAPSLVSRPPLPPIRAPATSPSVSCSTTSGPRVSAPVSA